jgi:hypothetical protein
MNQEEKEKLRMLEIKIKGLERKILLLKKLLVNELK